MSHLDDLVAEAESRLSRGGPGRTWYDQIPPEEKALVDVLVNRAKTSGELPVMSRVASVLKREFGDPCSPTTVRNHFLKALETSDES